MDSLDEKGDRLFDLFAEKQIEECDYRRQAERTKGVRRHFTKFLEKVNLLSVADVGMDSVKTILELSTTLKLH